MEAVINTRAFCLYLLIVAAWRRAVLCALVATADGSPVSPENHPDSDNTCADITDRQFYYHKQQISNVCDARTDILDTSSWNNDSSWIWEQAFFNDFAPGMSLAEYEKTTSIVRTNAKSVNCATGSAAVYNEAMKAEHEDTFESSNSSLYPAATEVVYSPADVYGQITERRQ